MIYKNGPHGPVVPIETRENGTTIEKHLSLDEQIYSQPGCRLAFSFQEEKRSKRKEVSRNLIDCSGWASSL